jgi:hypothetical protein
MRVARRDTHKAVGALEAVFGHLLVGPLSITPILNLANQIGKEAGLRF